MTSSAPSQALALLAKTPEKGAVKTRLAATIGVKLAMRLYQAFLTDTLSKMRHYQNGDVETELVVFLTQASAPRSQSADRVDLGGFNQEKQADGTLGDRLLDAFQVLLSRHQRAAIIGADSPTLPEFYLHEAFDYLEATDLVLGPSFDGGYYLIGMKTPAPSLFQGISWSTPNVLTQTLEKAASAKLSVQLLAPWYDIDDVQDLKFLKKHLEASSPGADFAQSPATQKLLAQLRDLDAFL